MMIHPQNSLSWFTGFIGVVLLVAATAIAPPFQSLFGFPVESLLMQCVGWWLALSAGGCGLLLFLLRHRISGRNVALFVGSCLFSLILAESVLALVGFQTPYHIIFTIPDFVSWATVDAEKGIRYIPEKYYDNKWPINKDGFPGSTSFESITPDDYDARVLFIGDSFTFGVEASAYKNSYVALVEKKLQEIGSTLVWNASIPGTGQAQQWYSLQHYFPSLKPQLVVLGLCTNDFTDNQYPIDGVYIFKPGKWVFRYAKDSEGNPVSLTPSQAYRRAFNAAERPIEYLASTRVGYLALRSFDLILRKLRDVPPEREEISPPVTNIPGYEETKKYLQLIRDYVHHNDAEFFVVTIPFTCDVGEAKLWYLAATTVCDELAIPYIDPLPNLLVSDYVPPPNDHWNDSGHAKVAEMLFPYMKDVLFVDN